MVGVWIAYSDSSSSFCDCLIKRNWSDFCYVIKWLWNNDTQYINIFINLHTNVYLKRYSIVSQGAPPSSTIQLHVVTFNLDVSAFTRVLVYDGPDATYPLLGVYDSKTLPPAVIESTSSWLNVVFVSSSLSTMEGGFNFTYQIGGTSAFL